LQVPSNGRPNVACLRGVPGHALGHVLGHIQEFLLAHDANSHRNGSSSCPGSETCHCTFQPVSLQEYPHHCSNGVRNASATMTAESHVECTQVGRVHRDRTPPAFPRRTCAPHGCATPANWTLHISCQRNRLRSAMTHAKNMRDASSKCNSPRDAAFNGAVVARESRPTLANDA